ncbi:sensor histidine kinase [Lachnoclostridium phytofermentans]|uniref:sensor histidine kinase n=1 Tax=Lachnoclostridium phytofermentans TaxID=66219 RepID=UPI0004950A24|nr:HAMP domain-containing sensor histidine kinase [Lachnoclostridium phytofermentans]
MLQKLRIKFIALAMGLLFLVLSVIMGAVNLLNYQHVLSSSDNTLKLLLSNGGRFPEKHSMEDKYFERKMSPELPFETRFFTVRLDRAGAVTFVDTGKIAAVTPETAVAYTEQVWDLGRSKGFVGEYRFAIQSDSMGSMIVFLDCGRTLDSVKSFLLISVGISLAGFFMVSLLLYILSARIVKPISDSYEKQTQFITNASHDLKTPITIIDADVDVLEIEHGENEWFQDIKKQTKRLTGLIHELVFLSRMEEKDSHFQVIDFPMSDVISETAQSFESLAVSQGKTFTIQVPPLISYHGDEKAIRQLVTILLDNALKYSDDRGTISLTLEQAARYLCLSVQNTCEPILPEDRKHLFDRFYRTDKSRNSQTGGYGIGLSIAKAIVATHKGTIRADSPDGHSLIISARFPI